MYENLLQAIAFIEAQPIWLGLLVLGLGAGIEYVVPPFPGDTVTLAGAVLIPTAGWPWPGVFAAVIAGSLAGAALDWWVGRWLARTDRQTWLHVWLGRDGVREKVETLRERFQKHGATYILFNRFIPAFRGVFFVAAGLAGLPLGRVMLFAAISAALWNGAILSLGALVGYNLERLAGLVEGYSQVMLAIIAALVVAWLVRQWWERSSRERG